MFRPGTKGVSNEGKTQMEKVKKLLNEIFIDGLSGMATGLFATLIVGTIIQQIGNLIPGAVGSYLFLIGKWRLPLRVPASAPAWL